MKFSESLATLLHLVFLIGVLVIVVFAAYSLTLLDQIVHVRLYSYGLQFSLDWANAYWQTLHIVQASLGLVAVFSLSFVAFTYRKYVHRGAHARFMLSVSESEKIALPKQMPEAPRAPEASLPLAASVSSLFRCHHCSKSFTQPLRMLDFHGDRPRIISLCPFCNEIISPMLRQRDRNQDKKAEFQKGKTNSQKQESTALASIIDK